MASLLRSAQGAKSAALQDELGREGLNGDGIAKSLVVYRELVRVGGYREGPTQSSAWTGCYRGALDSFLRGVLMGQETIVIHLHIAKVRVRTFTVSTKDRIDRRLLAAMSTLYGVRPQQQQIEKFRSDSMTPTPH